MAYNHPVRDVPLAAATVAFDLLSDILDVADHNSANYSRVSLAMQVLSGDLTPTQALDRADEMPVLR